MNKYFKYKNMQCQWHFIDRKSGFFSFLVGTHRSYSSLTLGSTLAKDQTRVSHVQNKCPTCCSIFPALESQYLGEFPHTAAIH